MLDCLHIYETIEILTVLYFSCLDVVYDESLLLAQYKIGDFYGRMRHIDWADSAKFSNILHTQLGNN